MKNYKIAIFTPYFGHINSFFKIWLKTAIFNKTIDFYILTDCKNEIISIKMTGDNIHVIEMTLTNFKKRLDKAMGFECNLDHPRKVCDYRSCLGFVFSEIVGPYDFWGYTDNDQIYGNIRAFITNDLLSKYDKIGKWGHFSLYRNTPAMNSLFMSDFRKLGLLFYKDVFSTPYNCFFEETTMYRFGELSGFPCYDDESIIFDCSPSSFRFIDRKWGKEKSAPHIVVFDSGKVLTYVVDSNCLRTSREVIYAHFQKRRMDIICKNLIQSDCLFFYPNVVCDKETYDEKKALKSANKMKLFYGIKKDLAHRFAIKYNNFHKKHSKKFKQIYY